MKYPNKISLDGVIDKGGAVTYIGDATYSHGEGFYKCMARVGEALCVVEAHLTFLEPPNPWRDCLPKCHHGDCPNIGTKWVARHILYCDTHGSQFLRDAPWAELARSENR